MAEVWGAWVKRQHGPHLLHPLHGIQLVLEPIMEQLLSHLWRFQGS